MRAENSGGMRWIGPGLGALTAGALFAFRSLELTGDSLLELRAIASGSLTWHPHHLLYTHILRGLYLALVALVPTCDPLFVAQAHSALWAGLAVMAAYWIFLNELGSRLAAALWALALAASAGFVTHATQLEAYLPATGCLLLLGALLLRAPSGATRTAAAVLLFSGAVLYHQSAVLFAVPLVFLLRRGSQDGRESSGRGALQCILLLGASGTLVLALYFLGSGQRSLVRVLSFSLTYLDNPNPEWASWTNLSYTGIGRLLRSQLTSLVHLPAPSTSGVAELVGVFALLLAGLAALAVAQVRRRRRMPDELLFPVAWLAAHYAFFLWFLPGESDHFVITVFPLLLFAALVLHGSVRSAEARRLGARAGIVLLVGSAAWNALHVVLPRHRDRGPAYREAAALARLDLVERSLLLGDFALNVHLSQFFEARATALPMILLQRFHEGLPVSALPAGVERVVVPVRNVLPDYRVGSRSGWTHVHGWLAFLRWISACESGDGVAANHAALALARTDSGERYLVLDLERPVPGDLDALLGALDALLASGEPVFRRAGSELARRGEE